MEIKPLPKVQTNYFQLRQKMWDYMRKVETFTTKDLAEITGKSRDYAKDFLLPLRKGGLIEVVGENTVKCGELELKENIFRVCGTRSAILPRYTKKGIEIVESRELMWRTMKMLSAFTPRELAEKASLDTHTVKANDAKDYIKNLYKAGFLILLQKPTYQSQGVYKLKFSMNTGPFPPMVKRTKAVVDQNTGAIYLDEKEICQ